MADEIKRTGSNVPANLRPVKGANEPSKLSPTGTPPPITNINGKQPIPTPPPSNEIPSIPIPQQDKLPTDDELKEIAKCLKDYAQTVGETLFIDTGNVSALLSMYEKTDAKELSPEKLSEILKDKSSQELSEYCALALQKYAIGSNGEWTPEFKRFLEKPQMPVDPKEEEKTFSFFTLMLLLNKLSSSLRDSMFKGSQAEQKMLEIHFDQKKDTIKEKAWVEVSISIGGAVTSGALSVVGSYVGLKMGGSLNDNPAAQLLISSGRSIGEIASATSRGITGVQYDTKLTQIEKEQSRDTFNKDIFNSTQRNAQEQANNANQVADEFIKNIAGVKSTIARA